MIVKNNVISCGKMDGALRMDSAHGQLSFSVFVVVRVGSIDPIDGSFHEGFFLLRFDGVRRMLGT